MNSPPEVLSDEGDIHLLVGGEPLPILLVPVYLGYREGTAHGVLNGPELLQDLDCLVIGLQDVDPFAGHRTSVGCDQ